MKNYNTRLLVRALIASVFAASISIGVARAGEYDDGMSVKYQNAFPGKKVVLVLTSLGQDIGQALAAAIQKQATDLGYTLAVHEYNWNQDQGAQAISQAISEKPDVLIVQNLDMQAYSSLFRRALAEGIRVVQFNIKATVNTDAYVGVDWYQVANKNITAVAKACSTKAGKSGKIAILQGSPNTPTNFIGMLAIADVLKEYPDITIVSKQAADWDANKAHGVVSTVLKQNPDLCGYLGFWDGQDAGMTAAINEAGKKGQIYTTSSGAAEKSTCERISDGSFSNYVSYNIPEMTRHLGTVVSVLLQQNLKPGSVPFADYTATTELNKDNIRAQDCWTVADIKAQSWK
jgi:ribose transport system substrate-binding protein